LRRRGSLRSRRSGERDEASKQKVKVNETLHGCLNYSLAQSKDFLTLVVVLQIEVILNAAVLQAE
jgi:hypothetical protein